MRLLHLLIPIAWILPVAILAGALKLPSSLDFPLFIILWFAGLPVYWWICRFFGIPPLFIFAPACPHCHKKPGGWWHVGSQMPKRGRTPERVTLACGLCKGTVELWLWHGNGTSSTTGMPTYRLRWPEFLGIWKRLPDSIPDEKVA
jgi:hypothetical protein